LDIERGGELAEVVGLKSAAHHEQHVSVACVLNL
jgi:hypothetical protein